MSTITAIFVPLIFIGTFVSHVHFCNSIRERYPYIYKKHRKKWDHFFTGFGWVVYTIPKETLDELDKKTRRILWLSFYLPAALFPFILYELGSVSGLGFKTLPETEVMKEVRTEKEENTEIAPL